jgi:gliding motility-associated-like protein
MYHLCSDKNTGSTRGGAPTTGAANHLICVDPSSGFSRTFTVNTGYSYVDADFKGGNSVGMNAIASSCTFLYTTDGKFVDKWDLLTGAHFTQVTVPGGSHSVGSVNSGIVCDKCGNVYVGSNGTVKVFDANLALINTIGGLPDVVSDMVWGKNGELFVCGGTSGSSPFVTSISVATCSLGSSGLSLAVTQPTCGSPLGVCTATVSFCGAPYSYSWSDGSSTQTVSTLGPGTYTVSVTGSVTCPFAYADINTFTINAIPNTVTGSIAAPTDVNCNGACNGSATITPGGGTGAGTYGFAWSPSGGSGATASSLCANTYTCVITDGNGCTNTQTTIINQPSALTSSKVSHTDVLCTGSSTGDATVSAANGSGGYSYTWSPAPGGGQGTVTATGLPANVAYTCTIHDAHGCSSTQAFTLTQPVTVLSSSKAGHTDILCTGGSTGDATVAAANGAGGYTYTWSPAPAGGQGTVKATGLPANVAYTCTIHDANGCTTTQAFTLSEPVTVLSSSIAGHTDILCKGSSTGDATVSAANGAGGYSYTWSPAPSGGQGTITATGLPANIAYTCNIHDVNGCLTSQTLTLVQPGTSLSIASQSSTVTGCGTSTGTATVSASGGTGVDSYTWAPAPAGGQGTATATGLSASNYTVTVHDANGCPITQTYAIGTAGGPSVTATALANAKCNVSCDGTVKANPTGGTGAGTYTYSWSGGAGTLATASSLCAGTYTCTIHDANNCLITLTSTITAPTVLAASSGSITPATCNGASTATATVAVTGGTGIYTYSWTGGAIGGGQGTSTATGLAPLVTYTCTVNDANSCVSSQTFTTTQPTVLTATPSSSTLTGCGTSVGTATVAAGGGTGADTYTWSGGVIGGGQGTTTATGLAAGTYTVTVHDTKNCPASTTYAITAAGGPSLLSSTFANAKCNTSCDGTASVTATGGTGAYTYAWTPSGGTAASASALCANTYTCKITDNNNCSTSQSFIVTAPTVLTASSSSQTNVLCTGSATGNATVSASGGAGTYTYLWTGGTITSGQGTASASGLTNGTYTCTVKDANACPASHVFTISQPITALSSSQFSQTNVACMGTSTGKATVAAAGGTGAYTYAWTGGTITSGQGTTAVSGLASGTYTCNITDGNTCQSSQIFTISQPPTGVSSVPFSQTNVLCTGFTTGAATVSVSGGTGAYTYAWTGGTITTGQGTATASGLAQGTYVCNITDAGGCPTSQSFTLTQPATSLSALPFSQTNVDCKGNSSASATVQASGGTVLYTYAWSGGTITGGQGTATATGLAQGTYICNINDANGCITSQSFTLTQPAFVLSSTAVQTNVSCNGGSSGSATISPAGGTAGYTYNWSSPAVSTTATASGLAQGTYSCTVTDANNCTTIQSLTITQPAVLSGTGTPVSSTCNLNNGTASVSPAGGSPQYTYSWSSGGATASTSGLVAGNYSCTITDSLACTTVVPVAITNVGSNPVAVVNPTGSVSFCQGQSTLFAASGGTSYSWNTGSVNNFISVSTPGTYTAYVTNSCGIDSAYGIATMNPLPVPAISGKDTLCKGDSVLLIASGGASYLWSNGSTSAAIYVSNTGNYTVSATNTCGSVSASLPVFVSSVTADFIPSSTSGSHPLPVTFKDSSSASAITWAWNFGDGSTGTGQFGNDYTYNTAGTYTVTLTTTNAQHCTSSHSEVIVVSEINSWLLPANVFTPNGDGVNDNWVVNAGGIDYFDGKIFDRWGVAMAQLVSSNEVWDGRTMGGLLASHGTYYYIIHAKGEDGKIYNLTGFIELIR